MQIKLLRKSKEMNIRITIGESINDSQDNNQEENLSTSDYVAGLSISNLSKELKESNTSIKGIIITNVDIHKNPTLRDLRKGDIIMQINEHDVENVENFQNQINLAKKQNSKKAIMLLIYRNGNQFFTSIKLKN